MTATGPANCCAMMPDEENDFEFKERFTKLTGELKE